MRYSIFTKGLTALTATAAVVAAGPASAQMYGYGHMWGWDGGYMPFRPFGMIFALALLVAVIWMLVRWIGGDPATRASSSAIEILRERFARGEINKDEYEERRRVLKS